MTYNEFIFNLKSLTKDYKIKVIGKTKFNRDIIAVERIIDSSFSTAIFVAGMHARENITSDLLFEMIKQNLFIEIKDFNLSFIIMANPDGIELETTGTENFPEDYKAKLLKMNGGLSDFSMWKANALGVDINNNFDARFGTNSHLNYPCPNGYVGSFAESELETRAVADYTRKIMPFFTVSYHSKGEEIYFNFFQNKKRLERDSIIAKQFSDSTGYAIKNVEAVSSGGYKDWCVEKLKIPSLTIEVGSDELSHPIGRKYLNEIFNKNKNVASDVQFAYNVYRDYERLGEI